MREHAASAAQVRSARVGRTIVGEATILVEEDSLLLLTAKGDEHTTRVRLSAIRTISVDADTVCILLSDGAVIALLADAPLELHAMLLAASRALPELTRGLRGFGSQRRTHAARSTRAEEQQRFFAPLLEARREAEDTDKPGAVLVAFDGRRLRRSLEASLHAFAQACAPDSAPARRAIEAELTDAAEPFAATLEALDSAARDARGNLDDVARWRVWRAHLLRVFEAADRAWLAVDAALESPSVLRDLTPTMPPRTRSSRP